ncbi:helix-turn-helix transcriptional regulator [Pseudodonghicola flavimaris]|uniref:Helix-turn-helix transcriptional regulator n=1 Tax=Pseudodonghicola flavimaris TaxID=3050036 RepID=A0ABT7F5Z4_9RHOB|nr:helix-turn-helix transcriptional regulator [Pseudodonghicola flavimaris]MDK3020019.1 helix-turn-helix transcriptional regulator [Pseudodonghicola flavimaris]
MQKFKSEDEFRRAPPVHFRTTTGRLFRQGLVDGQVVQFKPGVGRDALSMLLSPTLCLAHQLFPHSAAVSTTQKAENANFTLPLETGAAWRVNGRPGAHRVLFLNAGLTETQIIAPNRNSIFGRVSEARLQASLDALSGGTAAAVRRFSGPIELSAASHAFLRNAFLDILEESREILPLNSGQGTYLEHSIADILAQGLLSAGDMRPRLPLVGRDPYALYRKVIAYLEQAGDRPVCLSELCSAAGVSAPTLTRAFREVVGVSPMKFERLRRLAQARNDLLRDPDPRSVVKRSALRHGFRELGRFSALYKASYGGLPSQARGPSG